MPIIEEQLEIAAARADVFKFCLNLAHWPDWYEQVAHAELLTPAPMRSGTLLRIDGQSGGALFTWDAEFAAYQMLSGARLRVLDAASTSPFAKGSELTWQFESVGSHTQVTWRWDYKPNGFIARLTDRLGGQAATRRAIQRSLENLKARLESGQSR
jgi:uncharacterized membrane protein